MAPRRVNLATLAAKAEPEDRTPEQSPAPESSQPPTPAPARIAEVQPAIVAEAPPEPVAKSPRPKRAPGATRKPQPGEWVRYDEYERKEARLRADQYGQLSNTSRRLNRARKGSGERITENTLIRVAIDLLLNREDDLAGTTEAELRKSVGL
jgi:hypothetical protein